MHSIHHFYDSLVEADLKQSASMIKWLDEELLRQKCSFGDSVIPCFIKPYFLSAHDEEQLKKVTHKITNTLEKIVKAYFEYPELQSIFKLSKEEKQYVEMDPGYDKSIIISRPDGFMVNGSVRFIEFNCDSPAGAGYSEVEEAILRRSPYLKELGKKYQWGRAHRLEGLLKAILVCWKQFSSKKNPQIAIVDWKHLRTYNEFVITKDYFESKGYSTVIADPRELKLRDGKLYCGDFRVDLIYRRVIFKELWAHKKEAGDLLKAYAKGKVCIVNPFRSKLAANKAILSIMSNSAYDFLFTPEEIEIRDKYIPWTRRVIDAKKFYGGKNDYLKDLIIDHQKDLVLKPSEGYGGKDVMIGGEASKKAWSQVLERALRRDENWVVQEYVPIPTMKVPILKGNKVQLVDKKVNLNPFVFGGNYVGSMSRLSNESVINVSAGGGLIPAIKYSLKEKK